MNSYSFLAFGDELTKIAFYNKLVSGFKNVLNDGWNGTPQNPVSSLPGGGWTGTGPQITKDMGRAGEAWQHVSSLGGLTKKLPVGIKSLQLAGTAAQLPGALSAQDRAGLGRSRTERVTGLVGNTIGGLAGAGLAARLGHHGLAGNLIGGMAGAIGGEKLVTAPWSVARRLRTPRGQEPAEAPTYPTGPVGKIVDGVGGAV